MMILTHSAGGRPRKCRLRGLGWSCAQESVRVGGNTQVTIYNGTGCKLYDVVREGELLGR